GVEGTLAKGAANAEAGGDYAGAAQYYRQLVDKKPQSTEYKLALAEALRRGGSAAEAVPFYDAVLTQEPSNVQAQEGKAVALLEGGDTDGAERLLIKVKDSGKASWRTYNALGVLTASKESPQAAMPLFEQAERLSANNPSILNNIGLVQALARDFPDA